MVDARLPEETDLNVTLWHDCHNKCRGLIRNMLATPKQTWMWDCATPATQKRNWMRDCATLRAAASSATKYGLACPECDIHCPCLVVGKLPLTMASSRAHWIWTRFEGEKLVSTTMFDGNFLEFLEGTSHCPLKFWRCLPYPRLQTVHIWQFPCAACHNPSKLLTKWGTSAQRVPWLASATPAMQNDGGCKSVRKRVAASSATQPAHARRPVLWVLHLPGKNKGGCDIAPRPPWKTKVHVKWCQDCRTICRGFFGDQTGPSRHHEWHARYAKKADVRLCQACHDDGGR